MSTAKKSPAKKRDTTKSSAVFKLLTKTGRATRLAESAQKKSEASLVKFRKSRKVATSSANATTAASLNNPSRDTVEPRVVHQIALMAQKLKATSAKLALLINGDETLNLESDLKINENDRLRLSASYTIISESYGGKFVGPVAAKNATTVKKAIDLVHTEANNKPKPKPKPKPIP